ncbi:MAG TPA: tripartite tricarboxylate transporter substrate binding protein [Burkholderiales bacterium]
MRLLFAILLTAAAALAHAQAYPTKPVRMIIPFPPGGSNDVVGRSISNQLAERLGQGVVIDNRGGAGGAIGIDAAAKAPADGYTLLLISVSLPMNIGLGRIPQDALKAFAPVSMLGTGPAVLCVPAASPASSLGELIALAKRKPGELNAAAAGIGSFQHLATELFRLQAGIDFVIVQYKGGGPALTDLLAGQVQMNLGSLIQMLPHIRSGKLKALGVGGAKRSSALPDVPTLSEAGVPGYEADNWWGILAPAGTPPAVLGRLQHDIDAVLESPEMRKRFQAEGGDVLRMTPAAFGDFIGAETAKWTRVVKQAGIKPE